MTEKSKPCKRLGTLCFLEAAGKVLMMKRRKSPNFGQWTAPGGKIEFDESPEDCVIREMKEETGLTIHKPRLAGLVTEVSVRGNYNWLLFVYHCRNFTGDLIECEEGDLAWLDRAALTDLDMPESDRVFVPHVLNGSDALFQGKFYFDEQTRLVRYDVYGKT